MNTVFTLAQSRPTQRAADGWESARFISLFLASGIFYISSLFLPRPPAANANRWAAPLIGELDE